MLLLLTVLRFNLLAIRRLVRLWVLTAALKPLVLLLPFWWGACLLPAPEEVLMAWARE